MRCRHLRRQPAHAGRGHPGPDGDGCRLMRFERADGDADMATEPVLLRGRPGAGLIRRHPCLGGGSRRRQRGIRLQRQHRWGGQSVPRLRPSGRLPGGVHDVTSSAGTLEIQAFNPNSMSTLCTFTEPKASTDPMGSMLFASRRVRVRRRQPRYRFGAERLQRRFVAVGVGRFQRAL